MHSQWFFNPSFLDTNIQVCLNHALKINSGRIRHRVLHHGATTSASSPVNAGLPNALSLSLQRFSFRSQVTFYIIFWIIHIRFEETYCIISNAFERSMAPSPRLLGVSCRDGGGRGIQPLGGLLCGLLSSPVGERRGDTRSCFSFSWLANSYSYKFVFILNLQSPQMLPQQFPRKATCSLMRSSLMRTLWPQWHKSHSIQHAH